MKKFLLAGVFLSLFSPLYAQYGDTTSAAPQDSMIWFMHRKDFATYTTIAWSAGAVFMEFQWWWRDDYLYKQHVFELKSDGYFNNYSLGVDKLGHMYGSYFIFHTTYDFLRWAGYDDKTALWSAVAVPAAHALAIELADGFSKYGFSPPDLIFNSTGIVYGILQTRYPVLRDFNIKWSYYPSASRGRGDPDWGPASDYSGHIYWMAMNVHNLLPEKIQPYWPKFLNVAIGYGAKNVSYGDTGKPTREWAISFDWNMTELPLEGNTWEVLKNLINKIHFPAPGLRVYEGEKVQGKPLLLN